MPLIVKKRLPAAVWRRVHSLMPIICVDVAITNGDEILIVKRVTEPLKGEWFVPGGRVMRGETLRLAVERIARQEVGIKIGHPSLLGIREDLYETDPCGHGKGTHTISHCFVAEGKGEARLDRTLSDSQWVDVRDATNDGTLHRYLRRILKRVVERREPFEL